MIANKSKTISLSIETVKLIKSKMLKEKLRGSRRLRKHHFFVYVLSIMHTFIRVVFPKGGMN